MLSAKMNGIFRILQGNGLPCHSSCSGTSNRSTGLTALNDHEKDTLIRIAKIVEIYRFFFP